MCVCSPHATVTPPFCHSVILPIVSYLAIIYTLCAVFVLSQATVLYLYRVTRSVESPKPKCPAFARRLHNGFSPTQTNARSPCAVKQTAVFTRDDSYTGWGSPIVALYSTGSVSPYRTAPTYIHGRDFGKGVKRGKYGPSYT